jgi:hypothetical protein
MTNESKSRRQAPAQKPASHGARRRSWRDGFSMDSEQSSRSLLIGTVVLILIVAAGFIGFGYYETVVKPRNRTVLEAGGIKVSYVAMKRRMGYELVQNASYLQQPSLLPEASYVALLDEIVVVTQAESDLQVAATAQEYDDKLRAKVGVAKEANQQQFADALRRQLDVTGLHEDEYRRMVRAELLTSKIKGKFNTDLPANVPQARVQVMALNSQDDAAKALARVKAGEDWATVAKAVSIEGDVATTGGVHDYAPEGTSFNAAYDSWVFSAKPGDISDPLPSTSGQFFIVQVLDLQDKPVTEAQKPKLVDKKYNDWLNARQEQMTIVRDWTPQAENDALNSMLSRFQAVQRQQQLQQQQQLSAQQTAAARPADANPTPAPPAANPSDQGGSPAPSVPAQPGSGNGQ